MGKINVTFDFINHDDQIVLGMVSAKTVGIYGINPKVKRRSYHGIAVQTPKKMRELAKRLNVCADQVDKATTERVEGSKDK